MNHSVIEFAGSILVMNLSRYFLFALPFFIIFYIINKNKWGDKKIQKSFPASRDYKREILYSIITTLIFTGVGLVAFKTPLAQYTLVYHNINELGWPYWFLSIFLMLLLHDTYFYWAHRLMHHPKLFSYFHSLHHKSTNPSPWAAYAFQPLEGIIEASIIFPIIFLIPFHRTAILSFLILMIAYNVYGHLGYELYPKSFNKHVIGRWLNTSFNHNQHHKYFKGNYGLYFLFWDRVMGTIRDDYDKEFQEFDKRRFKS